LQILFTTYSNIFRRTLFGEIGAMSRKQELGSLRSPVAFGFGAHSEPLSAVLPFVRSCRNPNDRQPTGCVEAVTPHAKLVPPTGRKRAP